MAKIQWDQTGERYYDVGVDRGVLYVANPFGDYLGVPWNGLISISEEPTGGAPKPLYFDGYKYLNLATAEEFEATIEAFSNPEEFLRCDGVDQIQNGLYVTQQPRIPFGLSYRTMIGNDVEGTQKGYKIHIVYNALSSPAQKSYETIGETTEPLVLSWHITTLAPRITNKRPTAHLVIDSRFTPEAILNEVEDVLYGTDDDFAMLPPVDELIAIFSP